MLVVPHTYIDQDTGNTVANDTTEPDLLIDSLQGDRETDMASFGSIFFSAAYLSVNLDVGKFTLWSANVDTENSTQDFRALDTENDEVTTLCQAGDTNVQSNSTGSAPTTSGITSGTAAPDDEKLSTGATAGISVGVIVAVIGAVGGFLLYWMRRRKRRAAYVAAEMADTSASSLRKELPTGNDRHQLPVESGMFEMQDAHSGGYHRRELHEDWVQKHEMPDSGPRPRHELAG